ncbi:hypothetical protein ACH4GP_16465 [Streptomyces celluloflavus]|uniref:Integral membrane protein n=1 Tax=Streptomyces celluloflavus TaxID=58344 RepID=A0ABW7RD35_9ACTN
MSYQNQHGWNAPPNPQQGMPPYPPGSYQSYPMAQLPMPGSVRAARVLAYVAAGLAGLGTVVAGAMAGPAGAGAALGSAIPVIGVFICALRFARSGNGAKVTAIVFASLVILFGLGALGRGIPAGTIQLGLGIAIVATLSQRQSGDWFRRPQR